MNYTIKRGEAQYGPYSLADLQRYVASGNILLTDLCRSEGMADWVPVSQVIGTIPVPAAAPAPAPAGFAPGSANPDPPSLHWGIVLLLTLVTCIIFAWVWVFVQAAWVKKVLPSSKALTFYSIALALDIIAIVINISVAFTPDFGPRQGPNPLAGLLNLAALVFLIVGAFSMKSSIEEYYNTVEPIGLQLSGVMTFFFSVIYFQYHFTKINEMKQRQRMVPGVVR
jgi:hypothetical protein